MRRDEDERCECGCHEDWEDDDEREPTEDRLSVYPLLRGSHEMGWFHWVQMAWGIPLCLRDLRQQAVPASFRPSPSLHAE